MGIPSYFKNIIQDYPDIIIPQSKSSTKIDYLCLDLNCAIHPCCSGLTNEIEMYERIYLTIETCMKITDPHTLYIAIDGPAPRTKMEQQRQRRLKSSLENKIWDTNAITPGTEFMDNLSLFLREKCDTLKITYILSDSNEAGEGEHKIMKYIDTLSDKSVTAVYGLDADLIILSMIRNSRIFLLRETTSYNIEHINDEYLFLDISLLKESIIRDLETNHKCSSINLLHNYIFICFFLGNDFMIQSPSINIRYNGINILLDIYRNFLKETNGLFHLLTEKDDIHLENLILFIKELSKKETENILKIISVRKKQQYKLSQRFKPFIDHYHGYTIEEIIHDKNIKNKEDFKNSIPILYRNNSEKDILSDDITYYEYNSSMSLNKELYTTMKQEISLDYMRSLIWTTHYYFKECLCWKWYYPHSFSPLFKHVYEEVKEITSLDMLFEKSSKQPYTPLEQLSIVLPRKSHGLIRNTQYIRPSYFYPTITPTHIFMKRFLWECHSIMPHEVHL